MLRVPVGECVMRFSGYKLTGRMLASSGYFRVSASIITSLCHSKERGPGGLGGAIEVFEATLVRARPRCSAGVQRIYCALSNEGGTNLLVRTEVNTLS